MDYGERKNIFIDFPMHCCLYCMFMYKHSLKILVHKNMHAGMHDHACIFTHSMRMHVCICTYTGKRDRLRYRRKKTKTKQIGGNKHATRLEGKWQIMRILLTEKGENNSNNKRKGEAGKRNNTKSPTNKDSLLTCISTTGLFFHQK